jgi:ubiquinone/menaquinone biosynthesis C-methylase UbiE
VVFAVTLLQNIPDPLTMFEEIKRVSKREAIIAVTALKKEFSRENFTKLLQSAQLKILTMKADENLKDHIAICKPTK